MVDNPDVDYYFASLDDRETYRLTGTRGQAAAIGFTIGTDILRGAPGRTGTLGQYQLDDFALAPNGDYEIVLSKEKRAGNWMALPDGAAQISVRETFHDRTRERPAPTRSSVRHATAPADFPRDRRERMHSRRWSCPCEQLRRWEGFPRA